MGRVGILLLPAGMGGGVRLVGGRSVAGEEAGATGFARRAARLSCGPSGRGGLVHGRVCTGGCCCVDVGLVLLLVPEISEATIAAWDGAGVRLQLFVDVFLEEGR